MVNVSSLQNKINNKIFKALGSDITIKKLVSGSVDKWGDLEESYEADVVVKAVPYLHVANREDYNPFGDLDAGDVDMAFKFDADIGVGDVAVVNNVNFKVKEVEEFPLKDNILVKIARLSKQL